MQKTATQLLFACIDTWGFHGSQSSEVWHQVIL